MIAFDVHQPTSADEAARLVAAMPESSLLAGGMTLLPTIKLRLAAPAALVDLSQVAGMTGCTSEAETLTIGAMTRHVDVAKSAAVRAAIPALAAMAAEIGDPAVRNRGTLGGSLANNDPAADYPAAVLALAATVVTNEREIAAGAFFRGLFETALRPGEIITAVRFARPLLAGYAKFRNPASRFALVGVFVAKVADQVRVAVTGAGPGVFRAADLEAVLAKNFLPHAVEGISLSPDGLNSDMHAEPAYRAHLVTVMTKRAVAAALEHARGA